MTEHNNAIPAFNASRRSLLPTRRPNNDNSPHLASKKTSTPHSQCLARPLFYLSSVGEKSRPRKRDFEFSPAFQVCSASFAAQSEHALASLLPPTSSPTLSTCQFFLPQHPAASPLRRVPFLLHQVGPTPSSAKSARLTQKSPLANSPRPVCDSPSDKNYLHRRKCHDHPSR